MNVRRIAAAALTAGTLLVPVAPASATCYVGNVDICHKPTDPYTRIVTDPVNEVVRDVLNNPSADPVLEAVGTGSRTVQQVYMVALCVVGDYWYC